MLNARTELERHIWALVAVGYLQPRPAGQILIQQAIVPVVSQDTLSHTRLAIVCLNERRSTSDTSYSRNVVRTIKGARLEVLKPTRGGLRERFRVITAPESPFPERTPWDTSPSGFEGGFRLFANWMQPCAHGPVSTSYSCVSWSQNEPVSRVGRQVYYY